MRGGRGSSKSHTTAILMIKRMAGHLEDYPAEPVRIVSCRDFNTNLSSSVKVAVEKYIHIMGLQNEFDVMATEIRHKITGSVMNFYGVTRHPDSFLSMDDIDIFWMEQAECLGDEMIKIEPTIRKPGSELWFVWNPEGRTNYCWKRFVLNAQPGDVSIEANYKDNVWWFPICFDCNYRYNWDERDHLCMFCGQQIWPGLWELEESRRYYKKHETSLYPWVWLGEPYDGDATHQILPYTILKQCQEAWSDEVVKKVMDSNPIVDMGLDLAQGGRDKCAQVIRIGPLVDFVDRWPGVAGDLSIAANRCHNNSMSYKVDRLYYDGSTPMKTEFLRLNGKYGIRPVMFGGEVGGKEYFYETRTRNEDQFRMRNIQMADALRLRVNRTIRYMKGDPEIHINECLFINPKIKDLEHFLAELTRPIRRRPPGSGKWELDKRGPNDVNVESPDTFDALCLAYARDSEFGLKAYGGVL